VIRVAVIDDHPAVRLGLEGALRSEPGLIPVGSATDPKSSLRCSTARTPTSCSWTTTSLGATA
jgi:DNA-binding NarL/FixJ family response regulator